MKQTAASAATRNASRSFRSMTPERSALKSGACRKLPPISPHLGANLVGKKAEHRKIGHFTWSIQGKFPFRGRCGSGDMAAIFHLRVRRSLQFEGFQAHSSKAYPCATHP